jgi:hypothetical protein
MMNDLINRLRCHEQHAVHDYDDDCEEAANEIERLTAEVSKYKEAYAVCARALVLCDSTDRDAPVLNGELWSRARQVIDEIERD